MGVVGGNEERIYKNERTRRRKREKKGKKKMKTDLEKNVWMYAVVYVDTDRVVNNNNSK